MATKKNPETIEKEEPKMAAEPEEERVLVFVPYVEGEDPEVTVGINGVFTKIQKGKQVRVTKAVAEVLENSNKQVMLARENREKLKRQVTDL